jgi:hypothetical protein
MVKKDGGWRKPSRGIGGADARCDNDQTLTMIVIDGKARPDIDSDGMAEDPKRPNGKRKKTLIFPNVKIIGIIDD